MIFTEEQLMKIKEAKSIEELKALASAEGLDATDEQITEYFESTHKEGELEDDELDNVSGGGCFNASSPYEESLVGSYVRVKADGREGNCYNRVKGIFENYKYNVSFSNGSTEVFTADELEIIGTCGTVGWGE
ncbi:MAG: hypothetical protein KBS43_00965 [Oscillospiraceae bacterium]|nr:hypothetical protein [Candidatus Limimonas coprohippi]MCQ2488165.1 hypothetical protein [Clostridia bacterium]